MVPELLLPEAPVPPVAPLLLGLVVLLPALPLAPPELELGVELLLGVLVDELPREVAESLMWIRQQAQLVIITHQQQTMEAADVLYGVTMEPGGSSKVVRKVMSEVEASQVA